MAEISPAVLPLDVAFYIGVVVFEAFGYGIYCVIFAAFVRIRLKRIHKGSKALLYLVTANFIACTAFLVLDLSPFVVVPWSTDISPMTINLASNALFTCIDLISQVILIYRCWILWRQPWVMVVPILLTLAFLVISVTALAKTPSFLALSSHWQATDDHLTTPDWYLSAVLSFFSLSLVVNALVTGLIISKIFTVFRDIQRYQSHVGRPRRDVVPGIISILIESGMITFVVQLVQTLMFRFDNVDYPIIGGFVVMLYGISTAIVLVRVEMGLAYDVHNGSLKSLRQQYASSLQHPNVATTLQQP